MRVFFDTNVLVYLFDADAREKQVIARGLLEKHAVAGEILLSTQVLQEFYVSVTRKLGAPLEPQTAYQAVRDLAALPLIQIDASLVLAAIQRSSRFQLSFWDALIIQAALEGHAELLLTEDLQHGQVIEGLSIHNPFMEISH